MSEIINKSLMGIIKCYLNDSLFVMPSDLDIDELISLANSQNLTALVYLVLKKSNVTLSEEHNQIFMQNYLFSLKSTNKQSKAIKILKDIFDENRIKHCFFKGSDLRKLYMPNEEVRSMGDIDILVSEQDKPQVIAKLVEKGAINSFNYNSVDTIYLGDVPFEMHGVVNYFFHDIVSIDDVNDDNSLELDKYLALLVSHIAYHISSSGCGIRQYIDIAMFYKNYNSKINYENYDKYMAEIGLEKFGQITSMLIESFWDIHSSHDFSELDKLSTSEEFVATMRDFLLSNGVFGHDDLNAIVEMRSARITKSGQSKFATLKFYLFPPIEQLCLKYDKLKKYKILYPWYVICNIFNKIFIKKVYKTKIWKGMNNTDKINEKRQLLDVLDIK